MELLTELSKHHKEWLRIVKGFNSKNPEDIVQEMYIKLHKYKTLEDISDNNKLNKSYVWITLRTIFLNEQNKLNKVNLIDIDELKTLCIEDCKDLEHEAENKIYLKYREEVNKWHWADKLLFDIYCKSNKSMRKLSDEIGMSLMTIYWTIKKCKQRLKDNVGEDYIDYINKDFEKII